MCNVYKQICVYLKLKYVYDNLKKTSGEYDDTRDLYCLLKSKVLTLPFQSFLMDSVPMQGRSALDNMEMAYSRQVGTRVAILLVEQQIAAYTTVVFNFPHGLSS